MSPSATDTKMRWNNPHQWAWSAKPTHAAIVTTDTFDAAQEIFTGSQRAAVRRDRTKHPYVLSGLVRCDLCGRRMQGSWNNGQPYYRCRFSTEYAASEAQHAKTVYVRENAIVPALDTWIGDLFNDDHIDATTQALATANKATPADDDQARVIDLRRQLKDCDAKLAKYRALLEHDSDLTVAARWIAEVERERKNLERELGRKPTERKLTPNEIKAMVAQLRDIVAVLADADPVDKRIIYDQLGVKLTYRSDGTVHVAAGAPHVLGVGVGGGT